MRSSFRRCDLRLKHRLLFSLLCILIAGMSVHAQDAMPTTDDQLRMFAPTASGQTGLFETVAWRCPRGNAESGHVDEGSASAGSPTRVVDALGCFNNCWAAWMTRSGSTRVKHRKSPGSQCR